MKFIDPSSRIVTTWVGLFNYPDQVTGLKVMSAGVCHLQRRFSAGTYSLTQRAQIVLAYDRTVYDDRTRRRQRSTELLLLGYRVGND